MGLKIDWNQTSRVPILMVLLIFGFSLSTQANSVGSLSGKISYSDGTPAQDVVVCIEELKLSMLTDERGHYLFENLLFDTYSLLVIPFGNTPVKQVIKINAKSIQKNIEIEHTTTLLSEVTVEELSEKRKMEELGFAVNVIDTKTVELQSLQANDLLDRAAGVRIRQTGGIGSQVQYSINGLSGNSIRIFIDGIPISSYGASFSLSSIPTSMIDRIEVFKGVIPAFLSDDALGGAINVILKKSLQNSLSASYSFGSFNTHQANINGSFRNIHNGFTTRASAFYNYSDNNYDVWGEKVYTTNPKTGKIERIRAKRFHDNYRSVGGKIETGFTNVKWADHLLFGIVISDLSREIQHGATMEIVYGNRHSTQNTQQLSIDYAKKNFLVEGLDVSTFTSYSFLNRGVIDTVPYIYNWLGQRIDANGDGKWDTWASGAEGSSPTLLKNIERKLTSRSNATYRLSPNHRVNFNYLHSSFTRDQDDALMQKAERELIDTRYLTKNIFSIALESKFLQDKLKTTLFGKQYQQNVKLRDRVRESFTGIIKPFDYNKTVGANGYGIAASYTIVRNVMFVASAENAVRLPDGNEIFGNNSENIDPSYELRPETSTNLNLGLNLGTFHLKKHNLNVVANVFYRNTKDMIRQGVPSQVSETYKFENLQSVLSKGVDAEINYDFNQKFFYSVGASIFNARFNTEFDQNGDKYYYYQKRLRNAPFFTANNSIRLNFDNAIQKESILTVYYNLTYIHEFFRDWEGIGKSNKPIIPTQIIHDLGVTYTFPSKRIAISLDAKNITDSQAFDNWALQKPGRAFYIKLNYKLI